MGVNYVPEIELSDIIEIILTIIGLIIAYLALRHQIKKTEKKIINEYKISKEININGTVVGDVKIDNRSQIIKKEDGGIENE